LTKPDPDQLEKELETRDPDVRLMLQVRDDVAGAFEVLVQRYQNRLLGVMTHLIGNPQEAEDLTQDAFLRVYRARKGYRPRAKFSTWLFTIANNLASNHLRGKGRNPTVQLDGIGSPNDSQPMRPAADRLPGVVQTASAQLRQVELSQVIREALDELGDDQRLAVLLNKFEEMSYAEIADIMGRTEPAIKSLLARARMNLREQLEPYLLTGNRAGKDDVTRKGNTIG
jgi:RNA polymerase sigma-70 factor, ECF subfamily